MSVSFSVISLDCYGITTMPQVQYTRTTKGAGECRSLSYHRRLRSWKIHGKLTENSVGEMRGACA